VEQKILALGTILWSQLLAIHINTIVFEINQLAHVSNLSIHPHLASLNHYLCLTAGGNPPMGQNFLQTLGIGAGDHGFPKTARPPV
jgi:hypothetical protein